MKTLQHVIDATEAALAAGKAWNDGSGSEGAFDAACVAMDAVVETVAETAEVRALFREAFAEQGVLRARAVKDQTLKRTKFEDYYDFSEPVGKIPSHRYLAICRGETESVLKVGIEVDEDLLDHLLHRGALHLLLYGQLDLLLKPGVCMYCVPFLGHLYAPTP